MNFYDIEAQNAFFNAARKTLVDCLCGASFDKLRFRCWRFGDGAMVRWCAAQFAGSETPAMSAGRMSSRSSGKG